MSEIEFREFPKVARLRRPYIITEKIDGTNAAVGITEDGVVYAQSRKRLITHADDNFGFAAWVAFYEEALRGELGPGLHFGEWWGSGIQRGYGLTKGEKRFSLFNTSRWQGTGFTVPGLGVVPVLDRGDVFGTTKVALALRALQVDGSRAAPGFMRPEGVVTFLVAANMCFKQTLEKDEVPKTLTGGRA